MSGRSVGDLADVRTGDKGDTLVVAVVARARADYDDLATHLTEARFAEAYAPLVTGPVRVTLMPQVHALVAVLPGVLGAGVTGSPVLDGHGKALSHHLAGLPLESD